MPSRTQRKQPDPGNRERADSARRPPVIGLTGGIGSGKSTVGRILENLGCVVSVADDDVRTLLAGDAEVRSTLVDWWGEDIIAPSGEIDRQKLARIVFADVAELRRLERLLHPRVVQRRKTEWSRIENERGSANIRAFVIDAPLLFEAGLHHECDAVIFVDAPREIRIQRVREGRGWDENELDRREKTQWPLDRKRDQSDYVISNDASLDDLRKNVEAVLDRILRDTPGGPGEA